MSHLELFREEFHALANEIKLSQSSTFFKKRFDQKILAQKLSKSFFSHATLFCRERKIKGKFIYN